MSYLHWMFEISLCTQLQCGHIKQCKTYDPVRGSTIMVRGETHPCFNCLYWYSNIALWQPYTKTCKSRLIDGIELLLKSRGCTFIVITSAYPNEPSCNFTDLFGDLWNSIWKRYSTVSMLNTVHPSNGKARNKVPHRKIFVIHLEDKYDINTH